MFMGERVGVPANVTVRHSGRARRTIAGLTALSMLAGTCLPASALAQGGGALMVLPGSFEVGEGGAAGYTIPIAVPPGTAGMEPKLALGYSSQSGNGALGVGWSMSGLPVISRCPRTMAQDSAVGGVNYDANDRFCLEGQRLIETSGTYGANLTEYRTEREGFSKIVSYGTAGTGPAYFKVWNKAGIVMEFGNTADSRIEAQGSATARLWAVNKATDTLGNYWAASYVEDNTNGDFRVDRVDYTGNAGASVATYASVRFEYETRTDVVPMYHAGSLVKTQQRMKTIKTFVGSTQVREYRIAYQQSATTQRSRITGVSLCTPATGSNTCLPATSFAWTDNTPGFGTPTTWAGGGAFGPPGWPDQNTNPRFLLDWNGDGRADLFGLHSSGVVGGISTGTAFSLVTLMTGGAFGAPTWQDQNVHPRMLVDTNGDGLLDIVGFYTDRVYVGLNGVSSFSVQTPEWHMGFGSSSWQNQNIHPRMVADVNGDGRPDIVGIYTNGVIVAVNTGSGFTNSYWSNSFDSSNWTDQNIMPRTLADVNGDGQPDMVGFYSNGVLVALNTGTSFGTPSYWSNSFDSSNWTDQNIMPRMLADVNGDGLPDIVGFYSNGVMVALNTGVAFGTPVYWSNSFDSSNWTDQNSMPRMLVDVNGDGLPDIVGFYSNGILGAINTGNGFGTPFYLLNTHYGTATGWQNQNLHPRFIDDVNGDGLPDVVGIHTGGVAASLNTATTPPDLISTITSGLGAVTTVTYKSLSQPGAPYTKGTGSTFPVIDVQGPMYVVSEVQTSNGVGGNYRSTYAYAGARSHVQGRGFLGFGEVTSKDEQTSIETVTTFRQDWPFTGLVDQRVKKLGAVELNKVVNTYAADNLGGTRHFVKLTQSVETSRDLNNTALPSVTTSYTYDSYGNATQVVVATSDGFSKTTANTYLSPDTTNWILGRLSRAEVTSVAP